MGFKEYIIATLLVGLFAISIMFFAFQVGSNNDNFQLQNDKLLNKSWYDLNKSLNSYQGLAETQVNATSSEPPQIGFGSLILYSILGAGRVLMTIPITIYNIVLVMAASFGIPPIIFNVIITIVLITLILLSWRLYRMGM